MLPAGFGHRHFTFEGPHATSGAANDTWAFKHLLGAITLATNISKNWPEELCMMRRVRSSRGAVGKMGSSLCSSLLEGRNARAPQGFNFEISNQYPRPALFPPTRIMWVCLGSLVAFSRAPPGAKPGNQAVSSTAAGEHPEVVVVAAAAGRHGRDFPDRAERYRTVSSDRRPRNKRVGLIRDTAFRHGGRVKTPHRRPLSGRADGASPGVPDFGATDRRAGVGDE